MKLTGKMVCYFLVVVIVSTVGFGFIIEDSMGTKADVEKVAAEDLPKFIMVSEILENNLNQVANLRGYIITRNEQLLKNYQDLHEANLKLEQDLFAAAKTDEGRKMIQEMIDYRVQYAKTIDQEVIPLFKAGRTEEGIVAVGRAGAYVNQVLEAGKVLEERYRGAAHQSLAGAVASADHTINISIMAAVISIILSMAVAVFSSRNIANQVRQLADLAHEVANGDLTDHYRGKISKDEIGELASSLNTMVQNLKQIVITIGSQSQTLAASSEELTASADQSAQATQQVAGSVTEVAAGTEKQLDSVKTANSVVENMVAELEEVASNVSMVADKAVQTAEMATNGGKSATKAIEQMHEVEKTVSESAKVVAHLGERSKEIGQIVDTISGIAGQTN
ncbi:MAG: methyl-accepting chemotaxis protein, partial [Sporomusaceae bacterium]|nr:methyl-accepting chemotaxis protein [Sporomusaceae bacterium]